jgi:hypothetical protein
VTAGLQLLNERRIGLISSAMHLAAGTATRESLRVALNANAEHVRLPGLADDLNPLVLDPARVEAFLEGLPRQPVTALNRLDGRWLALGTEGMHLALASPVEAESIAAGYELIVPDEPGTVVQAAMRVPLRMAYAEAVAARARSTLRELEGEVAALEANDGPYATLWNAKWRRFAVATVWRLASKALAEADRQFKRDHQDAAAAISRYVTPPWVGMPPG